MATDKVAAELAAVRDAVYDIGSLVVTVLQRPTVMRILFRNLMGRPNSRRTLRDGTAQQAHS